MSELNIQIKHTNGLDSNLERFSESGGGESRELLILDRDGFYLNYKSILES